MSPFEDPEDFDSRYSWHYRYEYDTFLKKYEAKEKHDKLRESILTSQESYTIQRPVKATVFQRLFCLIKNSSPKSLYFFNKVLIGIKYLSCSMQAWLLF